MHKLVGGVLVLLSGIGGAVTLFAVPQGDLILRGVKVGPVEVGGLTTTAAAKKIRVWWEEEKVKTLEVSSDLVKLDLPPMKPIDLGVDLDDTASVQNLPTATKPVPQGSPTNSESGSRLSPVVFRLNRDKLATLRELIRIKGGSPAPAKVRYWKGQIIRKHETSKCSLDETQLPDRVGKAIFGDRTVLLPLKTDKKFSDDQIDQISDVVTEFSTRFPARNRPRCGNIKLAAHLIDGTITLPGESFSFNETVGRRTLKKGFQKAGVYINGQHDTGIGGGICQVSTTLYNSVLLANLPIERRSNHSLPVPYVPLGQDATVDYGNLDLVFKNSYPTPIAITSEYIPGKLTFRILGKKQNGLKVKIVREKVRTSPMVVSSVNDSKLAMGKTRIIRPGSSLRIYRTYRLVFVDGKLVKKESLGLSRYGGFSRIVAKGTRPNPIAPGTPANLTPPNNPSNASPTETPKSDPKPPIPPSHP
jgi:vancomycin resistance protein YoaR